MLHLAWITPLALLIVFLASPRNRGEVAESRVRRILAHGLEKNRYTILNDVVIPSGGGTRAIDHVVVSKTGIFVIESEYRRGWISGTDVQERWTQKRLGRATVRFDNPVYGNRLQAQALAKLLGYPERVFHRIVVMTGHKGFRHGRPAAVIDPEQLVGFMRKKSEQLLSEEQAAGALQGINAARLDSGRGFNRVVLLRFVLLFALLLGTWFAFGDDLRELYARWSLQSESRQGSDGTRGTEWEDALRCAWSPDTGRCACYEPDGQKADLAFEKCRELAERGSVLRQ